MGRLLYLWGQPGSGKSTLMRALTDGHFKMETRWDGLDLIDYTQARVLEIGKERPDFRGTDALGMAIITKALAFVANPLEMPDTYVMAEGDRLAVEKFWKAASENYILELVYLDTPDELAAERRAARGSNQNEAWVKGRITKSRRLAEAWDPLVLDGSLPVSDLVVRLLTETYVGGRFA